MKNTVRKGFLFLVLALFVVGGVFAQRVGDTVQLGGRNYSVEEVRGDGRVVLQPASAGLDGVWRGQTSGTIITISGNTGVYTQIGSHALMQDALSKGRISIGGEALEGFTSSGPSTWRGGTSRHFHHDRNNPNVVTSVTGQAITTITLSADGRSFTISGSPTTTMTRVDYTYTRQ